VGIQGRPVSKPNGAGTSGVLNANKAVNACSGVYAAYWVINAFVGQKVLLLNRCAAWAKPKTLVFGVKRGM
jgi:hypothetical protein